MHPLILFALFFIPDIQSSGSTSVKKMLEYPSTVRYQNYGYSYPDSRIYSRARVTTDENEHNPDARTIFIPLEDAKSGMRGGMTYTTVSQKSDKSRRNQNEFHIESFSIHGLQSPKFKSVSKTNKRNYSPHVFTDAGEREEINEKQRHKDLGHSGKQMRGNDKMKHNVKTNKMIYIPYPFLESSTNKDIKHNTIESSEPSSFKASGPSEVIDNVLGDKDDNIDWTFPNFEDAKKSMKRNMDEHFSIFNNQMNSDDMNMDEEFSVNSPLWDSPHLEVKDDGYDSVNLHIPIGNEMDFNHHGLANQKKMNDELSVNSHSLRGSSQRDIKDDGFEDVDFEFPNGNKMEFSHHGLPMKKMDDEPTVNNHFLKGASQLDIKEDEYENAENDSKMFFNHHGLTNLNPHLEIKPFEYKIETNPVKLHDNLFTNAEEMNFNDIDFHDSGDADIFKNKDVRHQNNKFPRKDKKVERELTDYDDFTAPFIARERELKFDDFELPEHSKANRESFISNNNNNNMKSDKETSNFESSNPNLDYFDFFNTLPVPTTTPMPQTTPMPEITPIPPPTTFNSISSLQAPRPDNEEFYEDTETATHHETSEKDQHKVDEESFWQKLRDGSYSSYVTKLINPLMNNLRNML